MAKKKAQDEDFEDERSFGGDIEIQAHERSGGYYQALQDAGLLMDEGKIKPYSKKRKRSSLSNEELGKELKNQ